MTTKQSLCLSTLLPIMHILCEIPLERGEADRWTFLWNPSSMLPNSESVCFSLIQSTHREGMLITIASVLPF